MSIERFAEWYPRYRQFASEPIYQEVYNFLTSPHSIWAMAEASETGKPALSGVVKNLENEFNDRFDFDNPMNRRMIGSMIKEIIHDFGFRRKGQRLVSNSKFFSTASYYNLEKEKAKNTVTGLFKIQDKGLAQSGNKSQVELVEQINKEQEVTQNLKSVGDSSAREDADLSIKELLRGLRETIADDEIGEQELQVALVKLITIGTTTLDSISALLKTFNNKGYFGNSITTPSPKQTTTSLSKKIQREGEIEVNKEEINWVLDEVLKELKLDEDIKIEKTNLGYKVTVHKKVENAD